MVLSTSNRIENNYNYVNVKNICYSQYYYESIISPQIQW